MLIFNLEKLTGAFRETIISKEISLFFTEVIMSAKILLIEDNIEIANLVELYLKNEGFVVLKFNNAEDAERVIENEELDLAILDIVLPNADGLSVCIKIREKYTYPVIMLTSKIASSDKVMGLTFGADDYVTKPFDPMELIARVKAQLRRYKQYSAPKNSNVLELGDLRIELDSHSCFVNEEIVDLTPTEFNILCILCKNKGNVVSSEELFHELWNEAYFCKSTNPIPVHISHIREKIRDSLENPRYIKTVWGVGYKIEE